MASFDRVLTVPGDIAEDDLVPLTKLAQFMPPTISGKSRHPQTLRRWSTHGIEGQVLDSFFVAGQRYSSVRALRKFLRRIAENHHPSRLGAGPNGK